jgi:hypothetical protein
VRHSHWVTCQSARYDRCIGFVSVTIYVLSLPSDSEFFGFGCPEVVFLLIEFSLCWYSFRYGDVLPCDSLPSSMFAPLVICKIINGSSGVPTSPPLRCLSQFKSIFWRISVISRAQRICPSKIPDVVVLFIDSQFTVMKLLECLEHNLIRSLSPRSHIL